MNLGMSNFCIFLSDLFTFFHFGYPQAYSGKVDSCQTNLKALFLNNTSNHAFLAYGLIVCDLQITQMDTLSILEKEIAVIEF